VNDLMVSRTALFLSVASSSREGVSCNLKTDAALNRVAVSF